MHSSSSTLRSTMPPPPRFPNMVLLFLAVPSLLFSVLCSSSCPFSPFAVPGAPSLRHLAALGAERQVVPRVWPSILCASRHARSRHLERSGWR
eukprot:CAMPEP_0198233946 /NCGR_PEP_ID=MMETSP1446-20131203/27_1 /TAXON_ID=1461542 ORGANISM="Unidentified sp, Strain CCMP2111" /NCGR_SAMPLE_ID=MMETSP1446 /ASSEMBLY_ACC=CAM_ASM_001112 /LENGTH=92 /DNA_ID=CAMNT_0043914653 /DNA_START=285 /DNA_END=560 /DNA_ORIENTATION=+